MAKKPRGDSAQSFGTDKATLLADSIKAELEWAGDYAAIKLEGTTAQKKNFAEALSRALAQRFADSLRETFVGILPNPDGSGQESKARTGKGLKRLDVNYSTLELGLGLGVSIKTINFRDASSGRYTKNFTRADSEFRAEADDYHQRQPYSVLCAVFFLPADACDDGNRNDASSFGQAVRIFRFRAGREDPMDDPTLFERFFIGLYDTEKTNFGNVAFFDVVKAPPKQGRPKQVMKFKDLIREIRDTYDKRNRTEFVWEDAPPEETVARIVEDDNLDE